MARIGFCGGSYPSQIIAADAERTINLIPENIEAPAGKSSLGLVYSPGLKTFSSAISDAPARNLFTINGRTFGFVGSSFVELKSDGTVSATIIAVLAAAGPASMCASPKHLLLVSANRAWSVTLATNAVTEVTAQLQGAPVQCEYIDGYFIVFFANSQIFQISSLNDATTWNALDVAQVSVFSDNIVSMKADHRELWLAGPKQSVAYYNSGNPDFPFQPVLSSFTEDGCAAAFSPVRLDNSIFWLSQNEAGAVIAKRANGYTPQRISTHAIEYQWSLYSTTADAVGWAEIHAGHSLLVFWFPTADATWVYDVSTQLWHERAFLDSFGVFRAHRASCHTYNFGKHLVGDRASGNIYELSFKYLDDFGSPIKRVRRTPYIGNEETWLAHAALQIDVETGVAPQPPLLDGNGNPRPAQMFLKWWDKQGRVQSNEHIINCGQAGEYATRAILRRLGRSRSRSYEISMSDPVAWRITDAYLEATPGYQPTERLASQLRKMA